MFKRSSLFTALSLVGLVAAGVFLGQWAWHWSKDREARAVSAAASAAAAAALASPHGQHRQAVRSIMLDPDSAIFREDREAPRGKDTWCGEVNARNRMGAMVGFTRYVAIVPPDYPELAEVILATGDDAAVRNPGENSRFDGAWRAYCE